MEEVLDDVLLHLTNDKVKVVLFMIKDRIRVLQFPIKSTKCGITRYVLNNWNFIDKKIFQFDFATMSKQLDFENELIQQGCKVLHIQNYAEHDANKFYDEFRSILKQGHYDIVHLHTSFWKSLWAERAILDDGGAKMVIHAHNTNVQGEQEDERYHVMERHINIRNSLREDENAGYWACSKMAADFLFGDRIQSNRVRIMHNAIDLERFSFKISSRLQLRRELGITDSDYVVGHVGEFVYQKNQDFLLKIFKKIKPVFPNLKLMLVGKGKQLEYCRQYVKELGLENTVIFTGYRDDIERVLCAFDLFVLPSRFEGLAFVLIEAQANGLMCYASDTTSRESKVSSNVEYLPLNEEIWIDKIVKAYHLNFSRENNISQIANAGYDIHKQIKIVEHEYCSL